MKHGAKWAVVMALPAVALIVLCVQAHFGVGNCTFTTRAGLLIQADFLDGSQSMLQSVSWHLGDATKCWGNTYGLKLGKLYWSLQVMHGHPEDDDS